MSMGSARSHTLSIMSDACAVGLGSDDRQPTDQNCDERFYRLVGLVPDFRYRISPTGRFVWVNAEMAKALGCRSEELVGKAFDEVFPSAQTGRSWAEITSSLKDHKLLVFTHTFQLRGAEKWFETRLADGSAQTGGPPEILGLGREVAIPVVLSSGRVEQDEETLGLTLKAAKVVAWQLHADGRLKEAGPVDLIFGRPSGSRHAGIEALVQDIVAEDRPRVLAQIEKAWSGSNDYRVEFRVPQGDGSLRWLEANGTIVHDPAGRPERLLGIARDITDRKRADEELRNSEERLSQLASVQRTILNTINLGISFLKDRKHQWANAAFATIFGYEAHELPGVDTARFYADETDYLRVGQEGYAQLAAAGIYTTEALMRRKDGARIWCNITGQAVNPRDLSQGTIWALQDITERRRNALALERERQFANAVLDSIPGLLYLYDDQGRLLRWNKQNETISGYSAEELSRIRLEDWFRGEPEEEARIMAALSRIPEEGHAEVEALLVTKDGRKIPFYYTAVGLRLDNRDYFVGIGIDISERRRMEDSLRESEQRFRAVVANAHAIIFMLDQNGIFKLSEGQGLASLGLAPGQVVGQSALDIYREVPSVLEGVKGALAGRTNRTENVLGNLVFDTVYSPYFTPEGQPAGVVGVAIDITERRHAENALQESLSLLQATLESTADGILAVNDLRRVTSFNQRFLELWRIPADTISARDANAVLRCVSQQVQDPESFTAKVLQVYTQPERDSFDVLELKDGRIIERHSRPQLINNRPIGRVWSFRDVTAHRQVEATLRMFQFATDHAADAIFWMNRDAGFYYVNEQACVSLGYTRQELMSLSVFDIDPDYPPASWKAAWEEFRVKRIVSETLQTRHRRKDGTILPVEISARHFWFGDLDLHVAYARDRTERCQAEAALRASLEEKEALLKEVHHRVKNNLQIVTSLLSLQSNRESQSSVKTALCDMQSRVRAMALLHEALYRSASLAQIDFGAYAHNLCAQLARSYQQSPQTVRLIVDIAELRLDLERSVPCGLIISELVTNAFKHAFPDSRSGEIRVTSHGVDSAEVEICIADNGVGLPHGFDLKKSRSLGLQLVSRLAEQLGGAVRWQPGAGADFRIRFPLRSSGQGAPTAMTLTPASRS